MTQLRVLVPLLQDCVILGGCKFGKTDLEGRMNEATHIYREE